MKDLSHGARKMGKFVPNTQAELAIFDNIVGKSVCMTERESALLSRLLQTAYFSARWGVDDDMDEISAWVANLDQKLQVFEGCDTMDCDDVANCITTSEAVALALKEYLSNTGQNGGVGSIFEPLTPTVLEENWIADQASCDNNILWGSCEEVVDGIFDATLELLQRWTLAADTVNLFGSMLEAIPLVGDLLSFGVQLATWGIETAYPIFQAVDSSQVRREMACDLFCYGKDECSVSMSSVEAVFLDSAIGTPPGTIEILPNLEWVLSIVLTGDPDKNVAASICMLGVYIIKHGGRFGEVILGVNTMQQLAAYGAINNPNTGWQIFCECVDRWEEEFVFTEATDRWHIVAPSLGVWQLALGWKHSDAILTPPYTRRAVNTLKSDLLVITGLDTIQVEYQLVKGGYYTNALITRAIIKTPSPDVLDTVTETPAGVVFWTEQFGEIDTTDGVSIALVAHDDNLPATGQCSINKITLQGNGPNPFDI